MIVDIVVDNSNQFMNPWNGAGSVEEALAVPVVVVMDLVVEVVGIVTEELEKQKRGYNF